MLLQRDGSNQERWSVKSAMNKTTIKYGKWREMGVTLRHHYPRKADVPKFHIRTIAACKALYWQHKLKINLHWRNSQSTNLLLLTNRPTGNSSLSLWIQYNVHVNIYVQCMYWVHLWISSPQIRSEKLKKIAAIQLFRWRSMFLSSSFTRIAVPCSIN